MTNNGHDILDLSNDSKNVNVDLDVKVIRILVLIYLVFGIGYWLELNAFLVPLPLVFYLVPFAAIFMYVRSYRDVKSIVLLILPVLVMKDLWININPLIVEPLLFISFLTWIGWGVFVMLNNQIKKMPKSLLFGISQILILCILLPIPMMWFNIAVAINLLLVSMFLAVNKDNSKFFTVIRIGLLIQLIDCLYLLQVFSHWSNS